VKTVTPLEHEVADFERDIEGQGAETPVLETDGSGRNGTISAAMASAAGVLMTAAIRMLPNASGMTLPSSVA
jgi:hypothetical protein